MISANNSWNYQLSYYFSEQEYILQLIRLLSADQTITIVKMSLSHITTSLNSMQVFWTSIKNKKNRYLMKELKFVLSAMFISNKQLFDVFNIPS